MVKAPTKTKSWPKLGKLFEKMATSFHKGKRNTPPMTNPHAHEYQCFDPIFFIQEGVVKVVDDLYT